MIMKKYLILFLLLLTIPASANFYTHYAIPSFGPRWVVPSDIPAAEAQALMDLYFATSGNSWTNGAQGSGADAWGDTATADDWYGVTVVGGHVTALAMPNNALTGNILSSHLPTTVETLDLGQNTGITDIDVSLMTAADNIDLAGCSFGSSVVAGILADVVTAGVSAGTLDIGGSNSSPNPAGVTSLLALEADSWTLTYSTVIMENTGSFYAITADGDATIRSSATDFSGQTGKYIVAYDGTNDKYAFAYGHGADDAEALGSELVANWDFLSGTTSWNSSDCVLDINTYEGRDDICRTTVSSADTVYVYQDNIFTAGNGRLYKYSLDYFIPSENTNVNDFEIRYNFSQFDMINSDARTLGSWQTLNFYFNPLNATANELYFYLLRSGTHEGLNVGDVIYVDFISVKETSALGTDALQLRSTVDGSTRNWASIESGFDPNKISRIEVFNAE